MNLYGKCKNYQEFRAFMDKVNALAFERPIPEKLANEFKKRPDKKGISETFSFAPYRKKRIEDDTHNITSEESSILD